MKQNLANKVREMYMNEVKNALIASMGQDLELLQVASNEFAMPIVDPEGNDAYVVIKVSVPKDDYDGYVAEKDYNDHCAEKAEKARVAAEAKAKKIAAAEAKKAAKKAEKESV